jgi:molecular chaperone DnaJ
LADKRDYYEVLGISKSAADDDIKKAYRRLAKQHHPDLNPNDKTSETKFKEVSEAYEILSNADKRARYDQFGHAGVDPNFGGGGAGGYANGFDYGDLGDIFSNLGDIFGFGSTGGRKNGPARGSDINIHLTLSFEEAAKGCKKTVESSRVQTCGTCGGTGAKKGSQPETCQQCHGAGAVKVSQRTPFGMMSTSHQCENCNGTGKVIKNPCAECHGVGLVRRSRKLDVDIPAGIDDGQVLAKRSEGDFGRNGGPAGDLNIAVSVKPHAIFTRNGFDVWCEIPVTFTQASLGGDIIVPTLDGKVSYNLPAGTQPGEAFRLKGKGITQLGHYGMGDQYVRVTVEIPKNLNEKQKELLRQIEQEMDGGSHYEKRKSFMQKLKDVMGYKVL